MLNSIIKWLRSLHREPSRWVDGNPPTGLPASYYVTGMRVDPSNPKSVIPCWRLTNAYYNQLEH